MKTDESKIGCTCEAACVGAKRPEDCPRRDDFAARESRQLYGPGSFARWVSAAHARMLGKGSSHWSRLEHIRTFCGHAGIRSAGLACCAMFLKEAWAVAAYLADADMEATVACCKLGGLRPGDIGRETDPETVLCNPVGQALTFNQAGVGIVIFMGLCAPHDMVLAKYAEAPCTTLFTKEHISNHAPYRTVARMVQGERS